MSCEGTCKKWFADRGFGFITQHGVQSELGDIFVHFTGISQPGRKSLNIGEKVTFDLGSDAKSGKPRAENVSGDGSGKASEELYPNKAGNPTGQPQKTPGFGGQQASQFGASFAYPSPYQQQNYGNYPSGGQGQFYGQQPQFSQQQYPQQAQQVPNQSTSTGSYGFADYSAQSQQSFGYN